MTIGGPTPGRKYICYLKLDGNPNDSSGNGYNFTDNANKYVPGVYNHTCMWASGTGNSCVYLGRSLAGWKGGIATIAFWARVNANPAAGVSSGLYQMECNGNIPGWLSHFITNTGGVITQNFSYGQGGSTVVYKKDLSGAWHYYVNVWDGTNILMYIDGALKGSVVASTSYTGTTDDFQVGLYYFLPSGYSDTNVNVSDLIVEFRGWTAQEIRHYYNQYKGRLIPQVG